MTPLETTYEDVKALIYDTVNKFWRRCGGDFDEYFSEANLVFMRVYKTYDPSRGCFSTLLVTCIYRRLVAILDAEIKGRKFAAASLDAPIGETTLAETLGTMGEREFSLNEFTATMTEDAKTVVRVLLETPEVIATLAESRGGCPRNWRSALRDYLYGLGWKGEKIREVFGAISAELNAA